MSNDELKAKRRRHEDRVTLESESLQRVEAGSNKSHRQPKALPLLART